MAQITTKMQTLEEELRASKRKISALTLDNENKTRKIGELEERSKVIKQEIQTVKELKEQKVEA